MFSKEAWKTIEPRSALNTLPTDAERTGDFSKSLNTQGAMRMIYDPYTSTVNAAGAGVRTPFAGNIIPASRIDPTGKKFMDDLWRPNGPGSGPTGVNNFIAAFANRFDYWNLSDRVDYNISDKLKVFGRYNQFRTFTAQDDYTGGSIAQPADGSKRHSLSFSGDAVYTLNATTVLNFRGAYNSIVDSFGVPSAVLKESDLEKFWPGNPWYKPYLSDLPDIYYPGVTITQGTNTTLGRTGYWFQEPNSYNFESKMSKNVGKHYIKVGGEFRRENTVASRPRPMSFAFGPATTANTFLAPNTALSGDGYATMLMGALEGNSTINSIPIQRPQVNFIGLFFHDDFKLTQKLTLNVGVRYEYFTGLKDPQDRLSRFLDLTSPIPEFQGANAPQMPAAVTALRTSAPVYNGAWVFTDGENRSSWNAPKGLFMPRVGLAYRMNDKTAIRVGFARYIVPATLTDGLNILGSVPLPGFDANTTSIGNIQGIPQQRVNNPFPGGLVAVVGKSLGRYTNLGNNTTWYQQDFNPGVNDRYNISVQRQLPGRILADVTFFMNLGRNAAYNWDVNQIDPRIGYARGTATTASVANPFFNILGADKMPGQLRTQRNIAANQLLRPYPQYSSLVETLRGGGENKYRALQMQFQRPFVNGFNMVIGYNYNRERNLEFYDEQDNFLHNFTWQPATNARHRLTGAGIYQLPVGKGRKFLAGAPRGVDMVLGGWGVTGLFTYNTGLYLRFGGMVVNGDPGIDNPTKSKWFDTSKFAVLPAFTRRSNPLQYDSVKGPNTVNVDLTMAKEFPITERVKFELRLEGYNVANSFFGNNPSTDVRSPVFGQIVQQRPGFFGRQMQYTGRIYF